jgi:hypothetical protein
MQVNFIIAGTQKGGTTALAKFLTQHPQICMAPVKEVHFFDYDRNYYAPDTLDNSQHSLSVGSVGSDVSGRKPNYDYYHSFFPNYSDQPAVGEATPIYMYLPWVAPRLHAYNPNMKLILILRNPIDRAYSHYHMELARQWEWLPFPVAIRLEPLRLRLAFNPEAERSPIRTHSYVDRGFYSRQIQNLLKYFDRQNLLILLNEELQSHHAETLKRVYEFLQVDPAIAPPAPEQVLVGKYKQSQQALSNRDRHYLSQKYQPEIDRLGKLLDLDLDLSQWQL